MPSDSIGLAIDVMKKETLNFRVSAEFKRKLIEEAKKERRSLTNYLEAALTKFWEQQESGTEKKSKGGKSLTSRTP
jgi:predicted HicB family RNase H-like nuclease